MGLAVTCPKCGLAGVAPDEAAGKHVRCTECRAPIAVPLVDLTAPRPRPAVPEPRRGGWLERAWIGLLMALILIGTALGVGAQTPEGGIVAMIGVATMLVTPYLDAIARSLDRGDPR